MSEAIYLDHNATTPILPEVFEAMVPFLTTHFANPSSRHPGGRAARRAIDEAREHVASAIGATPEEIVFTGTGTEASNLAIRGGFAASPRNGVVISAIEHPATTAPARWLAQNGAALSVLPVDEMGRVEVPDTLVDPAVVSVMHANNETGVMQPIAALAERARRHGALVHTDAAQSLGKVPVDVNVLGADLLTIAGHKLYAPKGVGALYIRASTPIEPVLRGAGHERNLRPGTENVAFIVGLGAACRIAVRDLTAITAHLETQRDALWTGLSASVPGLRRNGGGERLPNTLNVRFPRVSGTAVLDGAPQISASTGSACHADGESASAVILAMGVPAEEALGSVRLSVGRHTTAREVSAAVDALVASWNHLTA